MNNEVEVVLTAGTNDGANSVLLNGVNFPFNTRLVLDKETISMLRDIKEYKKLSYSSYTPSQILNMLQDLNDGRSYTLNDADFILGNLRDGKVDARFPAMEWVSVVKVEVP